MSSEPQGVLKFHIDGLPTDLLPAITWWLDLFCTHYSQQYVLSPTMDADCVVISDQQDAAIYVSPALEHILSDKGVWQYTKYFHPDAPLIMTDGQVDYLSTMFYLTNSLQEYYAPPTHHDHLGRYDPAYSLQHHYGCLDQSLVSDYMLSICASIPELRHLLDEKPKAEISIGFDIDFVRPSWVAGIIEAAKKADLRRLVTLILHEYRPGAKLSGLLETVSFIRSVPHKDIPVFWLPSKGSTRLVTTKVHNADYSISCPSIHRLIDQVKNAGATNGLHKSISDLSMEEELKLLPFETTINRNHFLSYTLPSHYDQLEQSKISNDYSLGYARVPGFRNSYDRAFVPFDLKNNKPYSFLEHPIHIMDVMVEPEHVTAVQLVDYISKQLEKGYSQNIVWHNSSFWEEKKRSVLNLLHPLFFKY